MFTCARSFRARAGAALLHPGGPDCGPDACHCRRRLRLERAGRWYRRLPARLSVAPRASPARTGRGDWSCARLKGVARLGDPGFWQFAGQYSFLCVLRVHLLDRRPRERSAGMLQLSARKCPFPEGGSTPCVCSRPLSLSGPVFAEAVRSSI